MHGLHIKLSNLVDSPARRGTCLLAHPKARGIKQGSADEFGTVWVGSPLFGAKEMCFRHFVYVSLCSFWSVASPYPRKDKVVWKRGRGSLIKECRKFEGKEWHEKKRKYKMVEL